MTVRSRPLVLGVVGLSLILTAAARAIAPAYRSYTPMVFPTRLELPGAIAINTTALTDQNQTSTRYDRVLSGQSYEYRYGATPIRVELRDLFTTTGDVTHFLETQKELKTDSLEVQDYISDSGIYRLFTAQNRTYLSSCIDVSGKASVTPEQFRSNRYHNDWKGDRLWRWATGQVSLLEYRCLWVLISAPIDLAQPDVSRAAVQTVWRDFEHQWRSSVLAQN
jgi:cyanosortase A-associated protein